MSLRSVLYAEVAEIDRQGPDDILKAIITQTEYAGRLIRRLVTMTKVALICTIYLVVGLYVSPFLTVFAVGILAAST
jgi:subfamily B ATP-binding cassette protein MsbA